MYSACLDDTHRKRQVCNLPLDAIQHKIRSCIIHWIREGEIWIVECCSFTHAGVRRFGQNVSLHCPEVLFFPPFICVQGEFVYISRGFDELGKHLTSVLTSRCLVWWGFFSFCESFLFCFVSTETISAGLFYIVLAEPLSAERFGDIQLQKSAFCRL